MPSKSSNLQLTCEWKNCKFTGSVPQMVQHSTAHIAQCLLASSNLSTINLTEMRQLSSILSIGSTAYSQADAGSNSILSCGWESCDHVGDRVDHRAFVRHVFFHVYHAKLKSLGRASLTTRRLAPCSLGTHNQNNIGDVVPSQSYTCRWTGCEFVTDNVLEFYSHANFHSKYCEVESKPPSTASQSAAPTRTASYSSDSTPSINGGHILVTIPPSAPATDESEYGDLKNPTEDPLSDMHTMPGFISTQSDFFDGDVCASDELFPFTSDPVPSPSEHSDICSTAPSASSSDVSSQRGGGGGSGANCLFTCRWTGCGKSFPTRSKLNEHLRAHTGERTVACPTCGTTFTSTSKFADHLERQKPLDTSDTTERLLCPTCGKQFVSERLLKDHTRRHVNKYKCPICPMSCFAPSDVYKHMWYRHPEFVSTSIVRADTDADDDDAEDGDEDEDDGGGPTTANAAAAVATSEGANGSGSASKALSNRPYTCSQCGASRVTASDLLKHYDVHNTGDRYTCPISNCPFNTRTYQQLLRHLRHNHHTLGAAPTSPAAVLDGASGIDPQASVSSTSSASTQHQVPTQEGLHVQLNPRRRRGQERNGSSDEVDGCTREPHSVLINGTSAPDGLFDAGEEDANSAAQFLKPTRAAPSRLRRIPKKPRRSSTSTSSESEPLDEQRASFSSSSGSCGNPPSKRRRTAKAESDETPSEGLYMCHMCDSQYMYGYSLTKHLKFVHKLQYIPGFQRFVYRRCNDGHFRLIESRCEMDRLLEVPLADQLAEETVTTSAPFTGPVNEVSSLEPLENEHTQLMGRPNGLMPLPVLEDAQDTSQSTIAVAVVPVHQLALQYPGVTIDGDVEALLQGLLPGGLAPADPSVVHLPLPVLAGVSVELNGEDDVDSTAVGVGSAPVHNPDLQRVVSEVLGEDSLLFAPVTLPGIATCPDADS